MPGHSDLQYLTKEEKSTLFTDVKGTVKQGGNIEQQGDIEQSYLFHGNSL